jgi:Zn-dependent protease with chaperone function
LLGDRIGGNRGFSAFSAVASRLLLRFLMRGFVGWVLVIAATMVGGGCASTKAPLSPSEAAMDRWASEQGGTTNLDARQARVDGIARRLIGDRSALHVNVHVLANDVPGAFGWPSGQLFVTRGLVDSTTDDELMAALAHELGHLMSDGHMPTAAGGGGVVVSLSGYSRSLDTESRADAFGVEYLRARGVQPGAMISLLAKVRGSLPPASRLAIDHRINLLEARLEQETEPE